VIAIAIAWTLAWPGATAAIVGARRPQAVDGWLTAASLELDDRTLDEVAMALRESGAGLGDATTRRPADRRSMSSPSAVRADP